MRKTFIEAQKPDSDTIPTALVSSAYAEDFH